MKWVQTGCVLVRNLKGFEMKFNVKACGLAFGILWGSAVFVMTWGVILLDYAGEESLSLLKLYPGYSVTPVGSLIGLAEGFVDGLVGGMVFAWLYNKLSGCDKTT